MADRALKFAFLILILCLFLCFFSLKGTHAQKETYVLGDSTSTNVVAEKTLRLAFTGDIMLDRGVEAYIQRENNWNYPFEDISSFFAQFDATIVNLEGPVMVDPPFNGDKSLKFAFNKKAVQGLEMINVKYINLANNHTDNMGEVGFYETEGILSDLNFSYVGNPWKCVDVLVDNEIAFVAFSRIYEENCDDDKIISEIKELDDYYVIALPHWGNEYEAVSNNYQKDLAHRMIDAGADLVVGNHPHVTQEIEVYNNKLIAYSLGNFVFDQHFSDETQEGLVLGIEIINGKQFVSFYPIELYDRRAVLQEQEKAEHFLKSISEKSNINLTQKYEL